ncbi:MAG: medium chain dehydrogenase/reductase family protein [Chromatiales bacterium]
MKRIVVHRPGGYDRLRNEQQADPTPGPGEVLIEVAAAGVNFADCVTRMGLYESARQLVGYPITPGFEVAGRVQALGDGVQHLRSGDPVIGLTLFGGYTTHLVLPRTRVFRKPEGWTMPEAAGFPTVFLTAWYALHELAHPRAGDNVLIHSAAGGVGGALTQLAKQAGCRVVGVVGASHKRAHVESMGADAIIDKSSQDLWAEALRLAPKGYELILDANGTETLRQSYRHLALGGKLVVYGFHSMLRKGRGRPDRLKLLWDYLRIPRFNPLQMTLANRGVLGFNLSVLQDREELLTGALRELLRWANEGRVRPLKTTTYPFDKAAEAHRALESGQTLGKIVLALE